MTTEDEFVAQLEHVPWFENIGRATAPDELVDRIDRWEHWPGPEAPQVADFFDPQQVLYDSIFNDAGEKRGQLTALWDRVQMIVLRTASLAVPYDPAEDAWHGPTAAVWHAVWIAGLIALCLHSRRDVPQELSEQWNWFLRGHWPCGYSNVETTRSPRRLLVL